MIVNLITDNQGTLEIWRERFSKLLNGESSAATDKEALAPTIYLVNVVAPPLDQDEVKIALRRLKKNKAPEVDGLPTKLFKSGGEELERRISSCQAGFGRMNTCPMIGI